MILAGLFSIGYHIKDLFSGLILITIIYSLAFYFRYYYYNHEEGRFFFAGLTVKLLGGILVGVIYYYWYGGGDTIYYFDTAEHIRRAMLYDFNEGMRLLFSKVGQHLTPDMYARDLFGWFTGYEDVGNYMISRVAAVANIIAGGSYVGTCMILSTLSFYGMWLTYRVFYEKYSAYAGGLALSILFIPSFVFWSSGILKESVCMMSLGMITYGTYQLLVKYKRIFISVVMVLIGGYFLFKMKAYILIAYLPAVMFWMGLEYREKFTGFWRTLLTPVLIAVGLSLGVVGMMRIGQQSAKFNVQTLLKTAAVYQQGVQESGGSLVKTVKYDGTLTGLITNMPLALTSGLFRPFLWEARNPLMLIAAIETTVILILTIVIIKRTGFRGVWRTIRANPIILFCLFFAVSFSLIMGLITPNMGALSRYRIPMLPFYGIVLTILFGEYRRRKREKEGIQSE